MSLPAELQGHAIKNKDLLAASGAVTLKGPESLDELEEDVQAVGAPLTRSRMWPTLTLGFF